MRRKMKNIIVVLAILFINGIILAEEINSQQLYYREKPKNTIFKIPSKEKAFTGKDYAREVAYPFMKRWIGKNEKYKNHPLFDAFCKAMADMPQNQEYAANIKKAIELLKKDQSDVISTLFLYCRYPNHFQAKEWIRRIYLCRKKVGHNNFINYPLRFVTANLRKQPSPFASVRSTAFRFAAKNVLNKRDSQHICRLIMKGVDCSKGAEILYKVLKIKEENIWLRKTLLGVAYIGLAWKARGSDWGNKVTEKGWKGFRENLNKAEKNLTEAWEMHKYLPEPAGQMIKVTMGKGSISERITWFNRSISGQVSYNPAYNNIKLAMLPRWGGSVDLLAELGNACYKSGLYECRIPNRMLEFYRVASSESCGYLWQKTYRRTEVMERFDKLLKNWCLVQGGDNERNRNFYKTTKAMMNFYIGNYKKTQEIISRIGTDEFIARENDLMKYNYSYFPNWIKVSESMKYFNSPRGKQLIQAETNFINGNQPFALSLLEKLLASKDVKDKERTFIADLWGRYTLMASAYNYSSGCNSLIVAAEEENLDVIKKLLKFGIDPNTSKNETGTPILISVATREKSDILALLLKAGAKVDVRAKNNTTPLMNALHKRRFENVKLLVEAGADVNAKVGKYQVWDYVKHANIPEITKYMKAHGAK